MALKRSGFQSPTKEKLIELQTKKLERLKLKQKEQKLSSIEKKPKGTLKAKNGRVRGKEKTQAQLKKELDTIYSLYVRTKYSDGNGNNHCYTCGKSGTIKTMQCGHFISRMYLATRWHLDNTRIQCSGCNLFGNGKPLDFEENLKKELGDEYVENLKKSRHQVLKLDRNWYKEQIEFYKVALDKLC